MANVTVFRRMASTYRFCPKVFGAMAPARGEQHIAQHLGGTDVVLLDHVDGLPHRIRSERLSVAEDREQLFEEQGDLPGVGLLAGDRDLVAAYQDLGFEGGLHDAQQLVALAEQRHHGLAPRHPDLHLSGFGGHQPGGHPMLRPPRRWKCRWGTLCPASGPTFVTRRHPEWWTPSDRARWAAASNISARRSASLSEMEAAESMWSFGMMRMWVGAFGLTSRNATTRSEAWT